MSVYVIIASGWLLRSSLRGQGFWLFMAAVIAIHGIVLFTVPWPTHYQGSKGDLAFGLGDLCLIWGLGALVARLTRGPK